MSKIITDLNSLDLLNDLKYKAVHIKEIERLTRQFMSTNSQLANLSIERDRSRIEGFQDGILFALCLKSQLVPELIKKNESG